MIHVTVGVYPNISVKFKSNGVMSERLAEHIKYNMDFRPGRAFFLDGVCIHQGGVSDEDMEDVQRIVDCISKDKDTTPYH